MPLTPILTPDAALAFVARHGIVLEAARGRLPSLANATLGTFRGSWWTHPEAQRLFMLTRAVRDSPDVLVCRLVDRKVTYVHRRLWPALVRLSDRLPHDRLARIREVHLASGKHVTAETPFPEWVPADAIAEAPRMDAADAVAALGEDLVAPAAMSSRRTSGHAQRSRRRRP